MKDLTFGSCFREQGDILDKHENDKERQLCMIKTFGACWTIVAEQLENNRNRQRADTGLLREFEGMLA